MPVCICDCMSHAYLPAHDRWCNYAVIAYFTLSGDSLMLIEVTDVVKEYRTSKRLPGLFGAVRTLFTRQDDTKQAVAGISFGVGEGELVGYIGPNGAGKST